MKQCIKYEDAFHWDCACCDEDCPFRKNGGGFGIGFVAVLISLSVILWAVL